MTHLYLSHNRLQHLSEAMVPAAVRHLHLDHNLLPSLAEAVVRRLEDRDNLTLALGDNPYTCRSEQSWSQLELPCTRAAATTSPCTTCWSRDTCACWTRRG